MSIPSTITVSDDERFFYDNAGFSFDPKTETQGQGKIRCAIAAAKDEAFARNAGWYIECTPSGETYAWQGDAFDVIIRKSKITKDEERFIGYDVILYDEEGNILTSLGGVTFKNDNPHGPYRRVLFAELAGEILVREQDD